MQKIKGFLFSPNSVLRTWVGLYPLFESKMYKMNIYHADYDEFFSLKTDPEIRAQWLVNTKLCEEPITQLINRYDIRSKRILSIGPSYGHEEYWFYKKGLCSLTFVDLDEKHTIENYLKAISSAGEGSTDSLLTYGIGDAREFPTSISQKFDVCYFSSFTPNELRNADVYAKIPKSLASRALRRFSSQRSVGWSWPEDVEPLIEPVMKISESALAHGGVFIYQSYASGVDVRTKGYLSKIKNQLDGIRITLVDAYFFVNYPAVHLVVGFSGTYDEAVSWAEEINRKNPELTTFHGRSHAQIEFKGVKKIYDIRVETRGNQELTDHKG